MVTARRTVISAATGTSARRADAGSVRLSERDVAGLLLAGDMYGQRLRPARVVSGGSSGPAARARTADYQPGAPPGPGPRYDRVVYLAAAPARSVVERAAASLPRGQRTRVVVRDLPAGAVL
jgi:hypothetical protein